jgi:hypothetical protein
VWEFFNAHPVVFLLTVVVLVCAVLYLVHLLVTHAGSRGEFKIGPTGVYFRGGDVEPRPGMLRGAWQALKTRNQGVNPPVPDPPEGDSQESSPRSDA